MNARYTQAINGRRIQMMVPDAEAAPAGTGSKASGH